MLNSEYRAKLEFKQRGTVLAGIIENPMSRPSSLLSQVHDIVGDYVERNHDKSDLYTITDHWVVFNPNESYWGIYYKKGYECIIDTRDSKGGSDNRTFINQQIG